MADIVSVPGDPSTEPVATALQSHHKGRTGPATIAEDADAENYVAEGVKKIEPGATLPESQAWNDGPVELREDEQAEADERAERQAEYEEAMTPRSQRTDAGDVAETAKDAAEGKPSARRGSGSSK